MSTVRKLTSAVLAAGVIAVLGATVVFAQAGPPNPSGGTGIRQTTFEGTGSMTSSAPLTRDLWGQLAWQSWFGSFSLSRYGFSATWVGGWQPASAIVRRSPLRR
jgi:hypothetical protein